MTSRGEQEQDEYDWGMMQQGDKAPPRTAPRHKSSGNWKAAFWLAVFVTVCFLIIWAFN